MSIVFAAPYSEPEDSVPEWGARPMKWIGVDGTVWPLTGTGSSSPRMLPGVKGLHMPRFDVHTSSTPLVPGEEILGYSTPARDVEWRLLFRASSALDWEARHADFFDSLHPVETGRWLVGEGDAQRRLDLRGEFDGSHYFPRDPFVTGRAQIGLRLSAPRPFWVGKTISRTYRAEAEPDFIPSDPDDQNYYPTSVTGYSSARIRNPGNEPAYVRWTVAGPHPPGVTLGVGTFLVTVPFEIPEGSTFILNTDPTAPTTTLDGEDRTSQLGFQVFAPVPPGGASKLVIASGGTGDITVELDPLYWRAF